MYVVLTLHCEHVGKGPGQHWEHRWRQFTCVTRMGGAWLHLSLTSFRGWLPLLEAFYLEIPLWWSFSLWAWNLLIWVSDLLPILYSTFLLHQSFHHHTFVVMPFLSYWLVLSYCYKCGVKYMLCIIYALQKLFLSLSEGLTVEENKI